MSNQPEWEDGIEKFRKATDAEIELLRSFKTKIDEWMDQGLDLRRQLDKGIERIGEHCAEVCREIANSQSIDPADWWKPNLLDNEG